MPGRPSSEMNEVVVLAGQRAQQAPKAPNAVAASEVQRDGYQE
jgi:hypothetical protein